MSEGPISGGRGGGPVTVLRNLQIIFFALVVGVVGFTLVVIFLRLSAKPADPPPSPVLAYAAVVIGAVMLFVSSRVEPEPKITDEASLVQWFQSRMIVRAAFVEGATLFAVVALMLTGAWWLLAVIAVLVVGQVRLNAPTQASVDEVQAGLVEHGVPFSLSEVLNRPVQPGSRS